MKRTPQRKITFVVLHPNETNPDKPLRVTIHKLTDEERKTTLRRMSDFSRSYVALDQKTDQPFRDKDGDPIIISKTPSTAAAEIGRISLGAFVDSVENLFDENDQPIGIPAAFDEFEREYLYVTLQVDGHPDDVTAAVVEAAQREGRQPVVYSFRDYLYRLLNDPKTFDPDPLANGSATQ